MTTNSTKHPSEPSEDSKGVTPAMAATTQLDEGTVIMALDLLAHWWSRPVASEVNTWRDSAELGEIVAGRIASGSGNGALFIGENTELLEEYERLFVGPGPVPCPPYE